MLFWKVDFIFKLLNSILYLSQRSYSEFNISTLFFAIIGVKYRDAGMPKPNFQKVKN
jgi:hypothetical protein